ncbi:PAS domain-containing sensor histidine kinase [Iningainema tapete]|uniref:PAS domain S-box protein n=1 Tax=Iningainema tapete BLCC-T55 TaxID=2748662 RepID=A0A8J6XGZ5_9CYAN|nr:PAS domain S-box protein [Iningainema tapete]MBD2776630.1 PAS domain S-box protein [Iningainema tapete BLCC-T55]
MFSTDKDKLQALFNEALDAMLIADDTGTYVDANPAACELLGLSRQEILTRSIANFTEPSVDFSQVWQQFLEQGRVRGEFRIFRPDGTVRETEYKAVANFVPHLHLSILRDITERKRTIAERNQIEAQLRSKQRFIEQIAESMPAILYIYDLYEQRNIYANRQLSKVLGLSPETAQAMGTALLPSLIHPDDWFKVAQSRQQLALAKDGEVVEIEYRMRHASGEWVWLYGRDVVLTRNADGSPRQILGTATDITRSKQTEQKLRQTQAKYIALNEVLEQRVAQRTEELSKEISDRHHLEEELRASQQKYKTLFDILPIGISITDPSGKLLEVNSAAEQILGISFVEHNQRRCDSPHWQIVRPDGSPMPRSEHACIQALTKQRIVQDVEMGVLKPNGAVSWLYVTASPIPLERYGVAIAYTDITDRKQAQDRLRASLQEKEVLLAEIHHRVKNNLYVICSLLELQIDRLSDPLAKAALENSCNRVGSMALVHENLYQTNNFSGVDFASYVQQLAGDLLESYEFDTSNVMLNFDSNPVFLNIDQAIPCGLLLNELITNALKHGVKDSSSGQIYIQLTCLADGWIELCVGNDGTRLPDDFDLERNASMGLRLVMMFVEQLTGRLELERGDVTWFKVKFPHINIK